MVICATTYLFSSLGPTQYGSQAYPSIWGERTSVAKGRLIHKKICMSGQVHRLSDDTCRLLYSWLLTHLDVEGRFYGDPQTVKSLVFPRRTDITAEQVDKYLDEMQERWLIERYESSDEQYLWAPTWSVHQNLRRDREPASVLPEPPSLQLGDEFATKLTPKGGSKLSKDKIKEDKGLPPFQFLSRYEGYIGYRFPGKQPGRPSGKEIAAAKALMENGYSIEEVCACHDWLKAQDFWKDKQISLHSILKQIDFFVKKSPKTTKQVLNNIEEL